MSNNFITESINNIIKSFFGLTSASNKYNTQKSKSREEENKEFMKNFVYKIKPV